MPDLPELPKSVQNAKANFQFSLAELTSMYHVLHNYARANQSTTFTPGSPDAFRFLRIRSVVRKLEAVLDAQAQHQLRSSITQETKE